MRINADFSRRATLAADRYEWVSSPQSGVERVMLDRVGAEKARATSIVRYAPGSRFPAHQHPEGEEILVLSGTFSEGERHFPAGWYMRNPPGSGHAPSSREGTEIFVKLRQMPPRELQQVFVDTRDPAAWQHLEDRAVCPLFSAAYEQVCLQRLVPGTAVLAGAAAAAGRSGGAELLVVAGGVSMDGRQYGTGSWIRLPPGDSPALSAGNEGATVYLKTGHLGDPGL